MERLAKELSHTRREHGEVLEQISLERDQLKEKLKVRRCSNSNMHNIRMCSVYTMYVHNSVCISIHNQSCLRYVDMLIQLLMYEYYTYIHTNVLYLLNYVLRYLRSYLMYTSARYVPTYIRR